MKSMPSWASRTQAFAISSSVPNRPMGCWDRKNASAAAGSGAPANTSETIGVTIVPGQIAFTRTPVPASSSAVERVIWAIAPLLVL
jgi:hypothetical protein